MVTAYFSDKFSSDREQTPATLHALRLKINELDRRESGPLFLLGHHPPNWFTPDTQEHLNSFIVNNETVYLHGHNHRVNVQFGSTGALKSLGFGAAYVSSLDETPTPYYRNSFAICELDDSLHLSVISWNFETGQWKPDQGLPPDLNVRSDRLDSGWLLTLPTTPQVDAAAVAAARDVVRIRPKVEECYWLAENDRKAWHKILDQLDLIPTSRSASEVSSAQMPTTHMEFRFTNDEESHLIYTVSAHGDIISKEQVERLNAHFDTETLASCAIVTLGEIADDARNLLEKLTEKKAIRFRDGHQVANLLYGRMDTRIVNNVREFDTHELILNLLLLDAGVGLLIRDSVKNEWYQVYSHDGELLRESDELPLKLRTLQPQLASMRYRESKSDSDMRIATQPEKPFSKKIYLEQCYTHFNDVRYAPLATLGFRFSSVSLEDLYIPASANYADVGYSDASIQRALEEYIESLGLGSVQKEQLERHMRSTYGLGHTAEVGAARLYYQKFGNVLVLGDPGSGKTCFVKYEILSYCRQDGSESAWYGRHLPVYVPLAETARLMQTYDSIVETCCVVAARQGIHLSEDALNGFLGRGHVAFFFDGVDEISGLDIRMDVISRIADLMEKFGRLGNRFVLTSRPAAIQPVEVPATLSRLQLSGLTEHEIRALAERIVSHRVVDGGNGSLGSTERELVDRLMVDCRETPGIGRIARNPLLLTLLVIVYANSGALYARRHIVYSQAVRTLISVRNRPDKPRLLSESDLRLRLGRLAIAISQRKVGEMPSVGEVIDIFQEHINNSQTGRKQAATRFLQDVAESTGLLVIHERGENKENFLVSFMHYSFLEYYAAVGLLEYETKGQMQLLWRNPRWREIVTLAMGILSEQKDITGYLSDMASDSSDSDHITKNQLIFALDCAIECDVPPEETQRQLMDSIASAMLSGPGRVCASLREELGKRLGQLFSTTGSVYIERLLISGIEAEDPVVSAAYVDLVSQLGNEVTLGAEGIAAFEKVFSRNESVVRCACADAMRSRAELRTPTAVSKLGRNLSGNVVEKLSALQTLENVHGLMTEVWREVVELLGDKNSFVASSAARCILSSGVFSHKAVEERKLLERSLRVWQHSTKSRFQYEPSIVVDKEMVSGMLRTDDVTTQETGIRYLPLVRKEGRFVYSSAIYVLKNSTDHKLKAATLQALLVSSDGLGLITLADRDFLIRLLKDKNRDVRIATIRILKELHSDEQIISALREHWYKGREKGILEEMDETVEALARHFEGSTSEKNSFVGELMSEMLDRMERGFGDRKWHSVYRHSLSVCRRIGGTLEDNVANRLLSFGRDFRTPEDIRKEVIRTYGFIVLPSKRSVENIGDLVSDRNRTLRIDGYGAAVAFLRRCRKRTDYIRRIREKLTNLKALLLSRWSVEYKNSKENIDDSLLNDIRNSVIEIDTLIESYEELSM